MIIAGVGLEQDVTMENVDMKTGLETGTAGMAGSAASPHLLYFMILSVIRAVCGSIFERLQAVGRYLRPPQGRRVRRAPVLPLPTLCLALAFGFFSTIGALAQEGVFVVWPKTHDGTPFTMRISFTDEGLGVDPDSFTASDITFAELSDCTTCVPTGGDFERDYKPTASEPKQFMMSELNYIFTVTPRTHNGVSPDFSVSIPIGSVADSLGSGTNSLPINSDSDGETIKIKYTPPPPNVPPVANAGTDQTVPSGTEVTLDGSGSMDSDSDTTLKFSWVRTSGAGRGTGSAVTLTGENTATPSFTPQTLNPGAESVTYGFTLTVTDDDDAPNTNTNTNTVTITVTAPLVADAGDPRSVPSGTPTVQLDGNGSTAIGTSGGRTVSYDWTRASGTAGGTGSAVTLTGENTATPSFTPQTLNPGAESVTYVFTLTVTDNVMGSTADTDMVTITVTAGLVADAGDPRSVPSGTPTVQLDGSGSTAIGTSGGRTVSYDWTRASGTAGGTGSAVTLTGENTATPSFTPQTLNPGAESVTYVFTLTVTDNVMGSTADTDMVTITVTAGLVADAGDPRSVPSGTPTVQLDGSGSTAIGTSGGRTVSYDWTRASGTAGGTGSAERD